MTLIHPYALLLLLLAIPLVVWYWRKRPTPRATVATQWLWDEVLAGQSGRERWLAWRDRVSLAVNLIVLLLVALAAADPRWSPPVQRALLIDDAASGVEPERFERVKARATEVIDQMAPGDALLVIAAADPLVTLSGLSGDRQQLRSAVSSLQPRSGPLRRDEAMWVARLALGDPPPQGIVWVGHDRQAGTVVVEDAAGEPLSLDRAPAPLWVWCVAAAVVLVAAEWCLFQRRWLS